MICIICISGGDEKEGRGCYKHIFYMMGFICTNELFDKDVFYFTCIFYVMPTEFYYEDNRVFFFSELYS